MRLEQGAPLKGVEAKLDRSSVEPGQKATLTFTAGEAATGGTYYVRIMPTDEAIAINVQVKAQ